MAARSALASFRTSNIFGLGKNLKKMNTVNFSSYDTIRSWSCSKMWCHWLVTLTFDPTYYWHFGWSANEERGQRSKWLTSYYVKISWILGSTWVSKSLFDSLSSLSWPLLEKICIPYFQPLYLQGASLLHHTTSQLIHNRLTSQNKFAWLMVD